MTENMTAQPTPGAAQETELPDVSPVEAGKPVEEMSVRERTIEIQYLRRKQMDPSLGGITDDELRRGLQLIRANRADAGQRRGTGGRKKAAEPAAKAVSFDDFV